MEENETLTLTYQEVSNTHQSPEFIPRDCLPDISTQVLENMLSPRNDNSALGTGAPKCTIGDSCPSRWVSKLRKSP